jgi:flagellar biosynthesis component FlhA
MEEGLLRQVTTRWEQEGIALFPFLRDGLAVEQGLVFPRLRFAVDRDLRPGTFAFKLNEIVSVPLRALAPDQLLLNDTVERVRDLDPAAAATVNPGSAYPASVVAPGVKPAAVDRGLTTWGQLDHIVLCLAEFLRQHGWRTVHRAGVRNQLRTVRAAFPALVASAQLRLPDERITAVLRSLLRDRVAVRNLRGVLEGCLDDSFVQTAGRPATSDARSDEELVGAARGALGREIAQRAARGTNALVVYLLDAGIERLAVEQAAHVSAPAADRILGAIRAELRHLPATAQAPHLLTTREARATLQRVVATEYPRMAVLAHEELPPGINLMPVARIQLQA